MIWTIPAHTPEDALAGVVKLLKDRADAVAREKMIARGKHREQVVEARAKELRDFADFLEKYVKISKGDAT